jgi:hypothetical protein
VKRDASAGASHQGINLAKKFVLKDSGWNIKEGNYDY